MCSEICQLSQIRLSGGQFIDSVVSLSNPTLFVIRPITLCSPLRIINLAINDTYNPEICDDVELDLYFDMSNDVKIALFAKSTKEGMIKILDIKSERNKTKTNFNYNFSYVRKMKSVLSYYSCIKSKKLYKYFDKCLGSLGYFCFIGLNYEEVMKKQFFSDRLSSSGDNVLGYLRMLKTYYPKNYLSIINMTAFSYYDFVDFVFDNESVKVIKNSNDLQPVDINHLPDYFFTLLAFFSLLNSPHELLPNILAIDYFDASLPSYVMPKVINNINKLTNNKHIILSTFSSNTIERFPHKNVIIGEITGNSMRFYNLVDLNLNYVDEARLMNGKQVCL